MLQCFHIYTALAFKTKRCEFTAFDLIKSVRNFLMKKVQYLLGQVNLE